MNIVALMYHDVVQRGAEDASGFPGASPAIYKLPREEFGRHLDRLANAGIEAVTMPDLLRVPMAPRAALLLTFDDGGASAFDCTADMLEARGWRGHFLITTGWIGSRTFLSPAQIRELDGRGHVIGTHSRSHPERMSRQPFHAILDDWRSSAETLADIVGRHITVASVPGGYYSRQVARAASTVGITALFTSEPTSQCHTVDNCVVFGRYVVQRRTSVDTVAALAAGRIGPRVSRAVYWHAKQGAKAVGGEQYLRLRNLLLRLALDR